VAARGPKSSTRAWQGLPRDVIVLGLIAFCVAVGFGVLIPVLPVFARSFGVGNMAVGAVVSMFALVRLVSNPPCARLVDRFSERPVLVAGMLIVAASSGLAGIAQSYAQLLVLRGAGGFGSAMFTVSAMTLLLRTAPPSMRGRASGFFQGGFLVGGMTGPAIGGLLAAISLTAPFFFYAGTLAVAGLVGLLLLDRTSAKRPESTHNERTPLRTILADPRFQAAAATNLAQGWTSFGVRTSLVPVLVVEVLHRPASWTGVAFAVASVVQTLALAPAGRFVDTVGRRPAMLGGGVVAAGATAAIPLATSMTWLVVVLCLYGISAAFLGTAPAAAAGDAAAGNSTAIALFSMCADVGAILGPLVAGFLADRVSYPVAFAVGAVLSLGAAATALRMRPGIEVPEKADLDVR
jgi:MFS family permease